MRDQVRTCITCGQRYLWNAGEQRFYRQHGLVPPKNCPQHRKGRAAAGPVAPPLPIRTPRRGGWNMPLGPIRVYGLGIFAAVAVLAVVVSLSLNVGGVFAWLIAVNTVALSAFAYDKAAAVADRDRVPEAVLLALALAGGIIGALAAMFSLRHKIAKGSFLLRLWLASAPPAALMLLYLYLTRQ
jgi:uncharacterized membrane protein YsdA (DUF1294 family)